MDTTLLIGYLASVCSVTSFMPQVWKVMKTGDTAAISAPIRSASACLVTSLSESSARMRRARYAS